MGPAIGRPYVDLEAGLFYRRAPGSAETKKRQPPVRLPPRLLAHLERWKRRGLSTNSVIEYAGRPIRRGVDQGFARAVKDASLAGKVTPHTLRHSSISWAMQGGAEIWDVSAFFGISPQLVVKVYGHFHPDAGSGVAKALMRKR
jgi:integrase